MKRKLLRFFGACLVLLVIFSVWLIFLASRPPAKRPDLVRLPDTLGPPPKGYPTGNAIYAAYVLQELGLADLGMLDIEAYVPIPPGVREETDIVQW